MNRGAWVLVLALAVVPVIAARADDAQAVERVRQTLRYGIDSQVLEAVKRIAATHDTRFTPELASVLATTRSPDLKKAILNLFEDQKVKDGEDAARRFLGDSGHQSGDVLMAAVDYLSTIKAQNLSTLFVPLFDSSDKAVASVAIRACGRSGEAGCTSALEQKLKDPDFPDALRSDVILALGDLKDKNAVDALMAIAKNPDEDKIRRVYAADALGRIGDPRALPILKEMFAENDALVRAYAASALAHFNVDEVFPMLLQGLKDDDWKVREQCAKALGGKLSAAQAAEALPALAFKASYDPVNQVRMAAINALSSMGGSEAEGEVAKLYQGTGQPPVIREAALKALVAADLSRAVEAAKAVYAAEGKAVDQKPIEATARVLSEAKGAGLEDVYTMFLGSPDPVVRAYAIRGIGANGFSGLKARIKELSTKDPSPLVQREAENALAKL